MEPEIIRELEQIFSLTLGIVREIAVAVAIVVLLSLGSLAFVAYLYVIKRKPLQDSS